MKPDFIKKESYLAAFDDCIERVLSRKIDLDRRTVVIVPDKYTLYAERRIFFGGGAFDVEVVTFSRLLSKTGFKAEGYISRFGAVMLLRKLIGSGEDLKCFHRSARFNGFAEKMYDTIAQIEASGVTVGELRKSVDNSPDLALKAKIFDIANLMERYESAVAGRYTDAQELLKALPKALKDSGYLDGATVYIVNFDRFTAAHRTAIDAVSERAARTFVYVSEQREDIAIAPNTDIEIYSAPDYESELRAAASRIRREICDTGAKLGDFCIVTANADYCITRRVMRNYGLDFELDVKYPLSLHPSVRYLFSVLDACDGRLSRIKLIALSKNMLTGISRDESSAFENYCNRRRIDYKGFLSPFDTETDSAFKEEEKRAERVRTRLMSILDGVKQSLFPRMRATDFACLAGKIIDGGVGPERFSSDTSDAAPYNTTAFLSALKETVDLMGEVMGEGEFELQNLINTLKEGVNARDMAFLPRTSDCVMIGQPALFRGQRFKRIFVLGMNDGILPIVMGDGGVITDGEIDHLEKGGAQIEPRTSDVNQRQTSELLELLECSDRLFLSYTSTGDGSAASSIITLIKRSHNTKCLSMLGELGSALYGKDPGLVETLACSKEAAGRLFLSGLDFSFMPTYMQPLNYALKDRVSELLSPSVDEPTYIKSYDIFFKKRTAYISQIQTFFLCPYRHFLQYGLKLKERADGTVTPQDVGIILHRIAERYVREGYFSHAEERAAGLFERVMREDFPDFAGIGDNRLARLKHEAVRLCRSIAVQYERSAYRPYGEEERFGARAPRFKTAPVTLSNGEKIDVVGVMDRVDICGNKARVIDYKTGFVGSGKKAMGLDKLYHGVKIQLAFYAAVLLDNGFDVGGMFYFPVTDNWSEGDTQCRMVGVFDKDIGSIFEMDNTLSEGGKSEIFNVSLKKKKDGAFSCGNNSLALEKDEFIRMCEYAKAVFDSGVADIDDGFIEPLPYVDAGGSACDYCPYGSICCRLEKSARS